MPVTSSSIGVTEPVAPTKKVDNVRVVTAEGSVERQVIACADPENPDARAKVTDAGAAAGDYASVVRAAALGEQADAEAASGNAGVIGLLKRLRTLVRGNAGTGAVFDSGLLAIPTVLTDVIATPLYMETLIVTNTTDSPIRLDVLNKAATPRGYLDGLMVQPRDCRTFEFHGVLSAGGMTWIAGAVGLNGQVKGNV